MTSLQEQATFETTKRLLFHLVNEGLVAATLRRGTPVSNSCLCLQQLSASDGKTTRVKVSIRSDAVVQMRDEHVVSLLSPEDLTPPVTMAVKHGGRLDEWTEPDPGKVFNFVYPWFANNNDPNNNQAALREQIASDLRNSAANQERWLRMQRPVLSLDSPSIAWEGSLLWGHPTHPLHRTMINPELTFLSVPRADVCISGPFEELLRPLLDKLDIAEPASERVIVPSLTQQQPSITARFPNAVPVFSAQCAIAQASLRTVTLSPRLQFSYHLKMSLACTITSALRTITPWSALGGLAVSELLAKLLPDDLWTFRERAAICGSQEDFDQAKHLACIIREDLEERAKAHGETLVIAAGLAQKTVHDDRSYAERLFGLDTTEKKRHWFRQYAACLLRLVLAPLQKHGICLEAHGQNMVVRINSRTRTITGFAVRDFGGLRLHMPTLNSQGYQLDTMMPGSAITTSNIHDVWSKAHHTIFQNHLGTLLYALNLEHAGGWAIIREEMTRILHNDGDQQGKRLKEFFLQESMPFKCFLRMKLQGKYRDYVETEIPNVLLL